MDPSQTALCRRRVTQTIADASHHLFSFGISPLFDQQHGQRICRKEQSRVQRQTSTEAGLYFALSRKAWQLAQSLTKEKPKICPLRMHANTFAGGSNGSFAIATIREKLNGPFTPMYVSLKSETTLRPCPLGPPPSGSL